jgi:hypothetical protein
MKKTAAVGAALFVVLAAAIGLYEMHSSIRPAETQATTERQPETLQTGEGMRVYLDPETGEFIPRPIDATQPDVAKDITDPMNTSSEGLIIEPAPGGGVMIDLRGRFRNMATATIDSEGNMVVPCGTGSVGAIGVTEDAAQGEGK